MEDAQWVWWVAGIVAVFAFMAYRRGRKIRRAEEERGQRQTGRQVVSEFHTKIAGVTFDNEDGESRQRIIKRRCSVGDMLAAEAQDDNQHDPFAVAVHVVSTWGGFTQIGYLNRERAPDVHEHLSSGGDVSVKITDITGGTRAKEALGINVLVTLYD